MINYTLTISLRPGVSTTRNALYLMKMAGLEIPPDIEIPK